MTRISAEMRLFRGRITSNTTDYTRVAHYPSRQSYFVGRHVLSDADTLLKAPPITPIVFAGRFCIASDGIGLPS